MTQDNKTMDDHRIVFAVILIVGFLLMAVGAGIAFGLGGVIMFGGIYASLAGAIGLWEE